MYNLHGWRMCNYFYFASAFTFKFQAKCKWNKMIKKFRNNKLLLILRKKSERSCFKPTVVFLFSFGLKLRSSFHRIYSLFAVAP